MAKMRFAQRINEFFSILFSRRRSLLTFLVEENKRLVARCELLEADNKAMQLALMPYRSEAGAAYVHRKDAEKPQPQPVKQASKTSMLGAWSAQRLAGIAQQNEIRATKEKQN